MNYVAYIRPAGSKDTLQQAKQNMQIDNLAYRYTCVFDKDMCDIVTLSRTAGLWAHIGHTRLFHKCLSYMGLLLFDNCVKQGLCDRNFC